MIDIKRVEDCCGCGACVQVCPKLCISMTEDNEGFLYPYVNASGCVQCGLCEKVCNIIHRREERPPLKVLAAINHNEIIRKQSSSGGIFHILAESIINKGGIVFGARFDKNWQVVFDYADTLEGIKPFMGSKYVQATIGDAYKTARHFLEEGRHVLFSGTPCQIAGLHQYLRKNYTKLLTVDFVCHGVPSPKVWRRYLGWIQENIRNIGEIEFRNKGRGWQNFSFKISTETTGCSLYVPFHKSHYMKAFLADIILRPSCYECRSKGGRSNSDITLADFWGISSIFPDMNDDKGTSMVFINTDKGASTLDFASFIAKETTYEQIKPLNPACFHSPIRPVNRQLFFDSLDSSENLNALIDKCTKPTIKRRLNNSYYAFRHAVKKALLIIMSGGEVVKYNKSDFQRINIPPESSIISITFRDKLEGWSSYGLSIMIQTKKDENRNTDTTASC